MTDKESDGTSGNHCCSVDQSSKAAHEFLRYTHGICLPWLSCIYGNSAIIEPIDDCHYRYQCRRTCVVAHL
jgi:hypothetical protein